MTDASALLAQVREALDGPCGKHDLMAAHDPSVVWKRGGVRLRDCPTCLPARISAAIEAGILHASTAGGEYRPVIERADCDAALAALRGER